MIEARDERGSMLPAIGGLLVVGLAVLGLCLDVAALHVTYVRASTVSDAAAEAGAAMIDEARLHGDEVTLDPVEAQRIAASVVTDAGMEPQEVDATESEVCISAHTTHRTLTLTFVGLRDVSVVVRACAQPVTG